MVIYAGSDYVYLFEYSVPITIMSADDFTWAVRVTQVGTWAIVGIVVEANSGSSISYSIGLAGDLAVGGSDSPSCYDLGNHNGFYVSGYSATAYFICGNHPLVTPASTYWYGHYSSASSNVWNQGSTSSYYDDSGLAVSWQGKTLPAGGRGAVTMFIRLGSNSWTPYLSLSTAYTSGSYLILTGSVTDYYSDRIDVYPAFDRNFAELGSMMMNRPSGSSFDTSLPLSNWYLTDGSHTLSVFAIDEYGMVSAIETRSISLGTSSGSSLISGSRNAFYGTATPYGWSPNTWTPDDPDWPSPDHDSGLDTWVIVAIALGATVAGVGFFARVIYAYNRYIRPRAGAGGAGGAGREGAGENTSAEGGRWAYGDATAL
jgi:hypothetical protein